MDLIKKLNPLSNCREYKIPAWQCPDFLFLIMGLIIISVIIATYYIATLKIGDPETVILVVFAITSILLVIDYIITRSFERIAEVSRLKTEFISIASHQLRTPLTNLKFVVETLITEKDDLLKNKDAREYLDILKKNTERMNKVIDELLVVSRLDAQEVFSRDETISLKDFMEKLVEREKRLLGNPDINVFVEVSPNVPEVLVDPTILERIIKAVLENAIIYTEDKGKIKIAIKKELNNIIFEISDSGVGIPASDQKYIFQKFFRSKNILRFSTQGSGLGLYIAKNLLKLIKGKIWFVSKEGKGSTFYIKIPIINKNQKSKKLKK